MISLADDGLTGLETGPEPVTTLSAGCSFDCVGKWVLPAAGFEGFVAEPECEGSS